MTYALAAAVALLVVTQDPPAPTPSPPPDGGAPAVDDARRVEEEWGRTSTVLRAFAAEARERRVTLSMGSGVVAAGLIGAGITYVAVSHLDTQLSRKDQEDTQLAGFVIGGAAVVPATIMVAQLLSPSANEERWATFTAGSPAGPADMRARVDAARASLHAEAEERSVAPVVGGIGFIGGGLVSAAAGGVFLALPHIPDVVRGPMTHATGAELIGAGVTSVGIGTALIIAGGPRNTAELQLALAAGLPGPINHGE